MCRSRLFTSALVLSGSLTLLWCSPFEVGGAEPAEDATTGTDAPPASSSGTSASGGSSSGGAQVSSSSSSSGAPATADDGGDDGGTQVGCGIDWEESVLCQKATECRGVIGANFPMPSTAVPSGTSLHGHMAFLNVLPAPPFKLVIDYELLSGAPLPPLLSLRIGNDLTLADAAALSCEAPPSETVQLYWDGEPRIQTGQCSGLSQFPPGGPPPPPPIRLHIDVPLLTGDSMMVRIDNTESGTKLPSTITGAGGSILFAAANQDTASVRINRIQVVCP